MGNSRIERILDIYWSNGEFKSLLGQSEMDSPNTEHLHHVKNNLVKARWIVIELYKYIAELHQGRKSYDKNYKYFESIDDAVGMAETYLKISEVNSSIKGFLSIAAYYGRIFIDVLSSDILAEHDVCQLFNINRKTFQDEKKKYIEQFGKEDDLTYKVISVCGAEYRHRKGRVKDFYDCAKYEIPVYWAISERIMHEMKNNKEFKKAADEKFKELFPGIKTYRAVKDLEGNIIKIVEAD